MKINKKLKKLAENLVSYGKKKGADQVEVLITESSDFSASVLKGKIEKLTEAGSKTASIKVIKEDKVANVSSSDLNIETLKGMIDRSIKRAPLLNPDPFSALPEKEDVKVDPESLKIYDEAIETLSPQKKR